MIERKIAALYEQRRRFLVDTTAGRAHMQGFDSAEGAGTSGFNGVGRMHLFIEPLARVGYPAAVRLRQALSDAVQATAASLASKIDAPKMLGWLHAWEPRGAAGWKAGRASSDYKEMTQSASWPRR